MQNDLFKAYKIKNLELKNRFVLAAAGGGLKAKGIQAISASKVENAYPYQK